jgi:polysaccharide biosynthesis protein PelC
MTVRALIAATLVLLGACATQMAGPNYVNPAAVPSRAMTVAILPFENPSSDPNAGQIVSQLFASELYARGLFRLMEETEARKRAVDAKLNIALLGEAASAAQAAAALGVDAILFGTVGEYRYQHGLKEEPTVGLSVRLVRRDGVVLWAASQSAVGGGIVQRGSLSETAQGVVASLADRLAGAAR